MTVVVKLPSGEEPPALKPHVRVYLKPGWRFESRRGREDRFVSAKGGKVEAGGSLPAGSRIVAVAPGLAKQPRESLSPEEVELTRHLQIILPDGTDLAEVISVVQTWECVERASPPPDVSLPTF